MRTVIAVGLGLLTVSAARAEIPKAGPLAQPKAADQAGLPKDLTRAVTPPDNGTSADKVALGEKLFFDGRLSADGTVACATCHDPDKGFTDGRKTSVGIKQQVGHRNAPTVLNALYNDTQFWDGRARHLEDQAKLPITNPIEMGMPNLDAVVAAVAKVPEYADGVSEGVRPRRSTTTTWRAPSPPTSARRSSSMRRSTATSPATTRRSTRAARRGWALFNGRGRCMSCHGISGTQPTFSDNKFHNIGVSAHKQNFVELARKGIAHRRLRRRRRPSTAPRSRPTCSELGRFLVTKNTHDVGAFKTPTLRNVLVTGPYFHDGSQETLWDVMDHYNKGGVQNPFLDGGIQRLGLSEAEIDDLVAFLASLTERPLRRQRQEGAGAAARAVAHASGRSATAPPRSARRRRRGWSGPFGDPDAAADAATIRRRIGGR